MLGMGNSPPPDTSESSTHVLNVPPIFNLHQDVLLHIFYINTSEPETEYTIHDYIPNPFCAIKVTRHSSQVCRTWRQTLLASPAIWGRIIDTTSIVKGSIAWAEEVLKRTGNSLLSIYGRVGFGTRSQSFFELVLVKNWHRVRRLDVSVDCYLPFRTVIWETILLQPAPYLESLHIHMDTVRGPEMIKTEGEKQIRPVITGSAPSLRRFHCTYLVLDPTAMWIAQLSSVTLSYPSTLTDMFTILSTAVRLESLIIKELSRQGGAVHHGTTIHLQHLRLLHVETPPTQALAILRIINGHPDCTLSVQITEEHDDVISATDIVELARIIASFARRFFELYRPPSLSVIFGNFGFALSSQIPTDMMYFAHPQFRSSFDIRRGAGMHNTMISSLTKILLPTLALIPLGSVTELEVLNISRRSITPVGLLKFFEALTSVQTLKITQVTIDIFNDGYFDTSLVFPRLETVWFKHNMGYSTPTEFPQRLIQFLSRRIAVSRPVLTLDIREIVYRYRGFDGGFLDVVKGLKVVWLVNLEEVQYICGSGEKEMLSWSHHPRFSLRLSQSRSEYSFVNN